jgi:hypothetical protein
MMSDIQAEANHVSVSSPTGTLALVRSAARDGAADAREAAERTWAATGLFMSRLVYTTCYTVSYGVVFPAMFLVQAIPKNNAAVQGLIDGALAAVHKVDELRDSTLEPSSTAVTAAAASV